MGLDVGPAATLPPWAGAAAPGSKALCSCRGLYLGQEPPYSVTLGPGIGLGDDVTSPLSALCPTGFLTSRSPRRSGAFEVPLPAVGMGGDRLAPSHFHFTSWREGFHSLRC